MARVRKKPSSSDKPDSAKSKRGVKKDSKSKKKSTFRERNTQALKAGAKPKRIRKAAAKVTKPASRVKATVTTEFHLFEQRDEPGFFMKSRRITPQYFVNAYRELRQVTWPGRKETWKLVFAVFVFAIALGGFIAVLDFGLEKLFRNVIL